MNNKFVIGDVVARIVKCRFRYEICDISESFYIVRRLDSRIKDPVIFDRERMEKDYAPYKGRPKKDQVVTSKYTHHKFRVIYIYSCWVFLIKNNMLRDPPVVLTVSQFYDEYR